ncbi:unnamed protein product [Phytomonas sp. Hart1]|nr:unnamed protein product [Phytomonas sp. Hart1]|eukprot:CCW69211.1 unnamed protein product [Phytomonas sp. isolate Hart1]
MSANLRVVSNELGIYTQATIDGIISHAAELSVITIGGIIAYFVTLHYIPSVAQNLFHCNLYGIDINKITPRDRQLFTVKRNTCANTPGAMEDLKKRSVPESLGILAGAVYLSVVITLIFLLQEEISAISGAFTTITVMLLLGFVDDVLDVRWRYKILLSIIGSIPLVMAYRGSTTILIPRFLTSYVYTAWYYVTSAMSNNSSTFLTRLLTDCPWVQYHESYLLLALGPLYLFYLIILCVFCTNSINILAGINGVEVGQSIVIAVGCVVHNLVQLGLKSIVEGTKQRNNPDFSSIHQKRALVLLVPFIGVSMALWKYNHYPARIFVGDSYTYFAGTVLAVSGIMGRYSKTLLLFFIPQFLNFLISLPQLFNIVSCPKHRVPRWIPTRDVLTSSHNYTLLNLILYVFGDMHERTLTRIVISLQIITTALSLIIRYFVVSRMFDHVY